jgi:hypothetical protein
MQGEVTLRIEAALPPGLIQERARQLAAELNAAGLQARPAERPAAAGARGGELVLGALLLEPVGKWAVQTFLDRLRGFLDRNRKVKVVLKRADGAEISIEAENMDRDAVAGFVDLARDGLG